MFHFGTCGFHVYFTALVDVVKMMFGYSGSLCSKQHCHLRLREPHCLLLHSCLQPDAVVRLVEDDFAGVGSDLSVLCYRIVLVRDVNNLFLKFKISGCKNTIKNGTRSTERIAMSTSSA